MSIVVEGMGPAPMKATREFFVNREKNAVSEHGDHGGSQDRTDSFYWPAASYGSGGA